MRLEVKKKSGKRIRLLLPTGLMLNRITVQFIPAAFAKKEVVLTQEQSIQIIQALHSIRRRHRGWKLIEADSADGDHIEISL